MAKISYVYVLVSLATNPDWLIYRLDVKKKKKKGFLHGDLLEEVYGATIAICCSRGVLGHCLQIE
jgi:hypothetical protein